MSNVKSAWQALVAVTVFFATSVASAGFFGNAVSANYAFPDRNSVLYASGSAIAGSGVEFPNIGGANVIVDFSDTGFRITYPTGWTFASGAPRTFDGFVISDVGGTLPDITGISIAVSNIGPLSGGALSVDANHVYVNQLAFSSIPAGGYIDVTVEFKSAPPGSCALAAVPASLPAGGGVVSLAVNCSGGDAPTTFAWSGGFASGRTTSTNTLSGTVNATTTFSVTAGNAGGNAVPASVTVTVAPQPPATPPPDACTLTANPASLPIGGGEVLLVVNCAGGGTPSSFAWSGGFVDGTTTPGNTRSGAVATSTTFSVVASNAGGSAAAASATVSVQTAATPPPSACTLVASPASLPAAGGTVTLTASCTGGAPPTSFLWSGGFGTGKSTSVNTLSGTVTATTTFGVIAGNSGGSAPLASATVVVGAPSGVAVEYFNAYMGHYFVTAFPEEAAAIDSGKVAGWVRTGYTFPVDMSAVGAAQPVCRFFSATFAPKSSHFYTPYAAECASVKGDSTWSYEAIAFYLSLPDAAGNCPAGATRIYRLYNNGITGAPNHRYTADAGIFALMKAQGWTPEGNGVTGVFACGPGGTTGASGLTGVVEFNPQLRYLTTADGSAIVEQTATRLVFSRPVNLAAGQVFVVPENGVFHATSVTTSGGQTVVTVEEPTIDEVFAQLEVSGRIDLGSLVLPTPVEVESTSLASSGGARAAAASRFTTEPKFYAAVDDQGNRGFKVEFNVAAECGSTSNKKMKLIEVSAEVYGPLDVKASKSQMSSSGVRSYHLKFDGAASVGCQITFPLGSAKIADFKLPIASLPGLLIRVPIFVGARIETDMAPQILLARVAADFIDPAPSTASGKLSDKTAFSQLLQGASTGKEFKATATAELDISLRVMALGSFHIASGGVKIGPSAEVKATVVVRGGVLDIDICASLKYPSEVYVQYRSLRAMNTVTIAKKDWQIPGISGSTCLAPPNGTWLFTTSMCAAAPGNDPTCPGLTCFDFPLDAKADTDRSTITFTDAATATAIWKLTPQAGERVYAGCYLTPSGECRTDASIPLVATFAPDFRSAQWSIVSVYGACVFLQDGTAVRQ